mmetsp:Transcript_3025/g.4469  ORF Transcript_3025/g.4469 Transcript_3025/m.4469 type:complete len:108 (-) Transcript_3025:130-453(-)
MTGVEGASAVNRCYNYAPIAGVVQAHMETVLRGEWWMSNFVGYLNAEKLVRRKCIGFPLWRTFFVGLPPFSTRVALPISRNSTMTSVKMPWQTTLTTLTLTLHIENT